MSDDRLNYNPWFTGLFSPVLSTFWKCSGHSLILRVGLPSLFTSSRVKRRRVSYVIIRQTTTPFELARRICILSLLAALTEGGHGEWSLQCEAEATFLWRGLSCLLKVSCGSVTWRQIYCFFKWELPPVWRCKIHGNKRFQAAILMVKQHDTKWMEKNEFLWLELSTAGRKFHFNFARCVELVLRIQTEI